MSKIKFSAVPPEKSLVTKDFENYNYCDLFTVETKLDDTVDNITSKIFKLPGWIVFLLVLRNSIVKIFGLKTGGKKDLQFLDYYPVGSRAVVFTVINRNENEIVMAENDKHLNFRASVLLEKDSEKTLVHLTTLVKFNNFGGKLYFTIIKPFHKVIIKSVLKRII
ncbi:MAG: DUF2867 domain-containing protein [Rhodothermaceae bacterium]